MPNAMYKIKPFQTIDNYSINRLNLLTALNYTNNTLTHKFFIFIFIYLSCYNIA